MEELNEKRMQKEIENLFSSHQHFLKNKYIFSRDWESDFFSVTKTGYCYEVEVKISKSDFKADFSKFKHRLFEGVNDKEVIKEAKYRKRRKRTIKMSPEKKIDPKTALMPNRFFFACPEDLIDVSEVPEYAGLIYVGKSSSWVVKQAPIIHKRKLDIKDLLFSKYQWSYINAMEDLEDKNKKLKFTSNRLDVMCRGLEKQFKLKEGSVTSFSAFKKMISETK